MLFILVISAVSAFELFSIVGKFGNRAYKLMLGYDVWIEIFFSVVLGVMSAVTGSLGAMCISMVTGLLITIAIHVVRHTQGYAKIEKVDGKRRYVEYAGTSFGEFVRSTGVSLFNAGKGFVANISKPTTTHA